MVCAAALALSAVLGSAASAEADLAYETLVERARGLAAEAYVPQDTPLPDAVAALDYDGHRDIRCLPENFLWHGGDEPFRVQFRHRGWLFKEDVKLATVDADGAQVRPLPFSADRFTYGDLASEKLDPAGLPTDMGYAGLALHKVAPGSQGNHAAEGNSVKGRSGGDFGGNSGGNSGGETFNEFMSIQGGSYFRAIGFGQHWGSSARGIAVNTGLAEPEEFPRWRELWVKQPAPDATTLTLYGLLDGPSVSGAYRFVITPGQTTSMDITAKLFFRKSVGKIGLAPLTGMFLFGEEAPARFGDYRPEVHDADGLLMKHADGQLNWRPLRNPKQTRVSRFKMTDPAGFGLIQRDRNFNHYEDLETEMQIRPSIWVTPTTNPDGQGWGEGWVELLEIASDDEGIDNIGAYWVPANETELSAGSELSLAYCLNFTQDARPIDRQVMPWFATRTMLGEGGDREANAKSLVRTAVGDEAAGRPVARFILDTAPGSALPSGTIVRHDVGVTHGQIAGEPVIQYNRFNHAYRLFFDVIADGDQPVELRATLRGATELDRKKEAAPEGTYDDAVDPDTGPPLSETWLYRWDPQP